MKNSCAPTPKRIKEQVHESSCIGERNEKGEGIKKESKKEPGEPGFFIGKPAWHWDLEVNRLKLWSIIDNLLAENPQPKTSKALGCPQILSSTERYVLNNLDNLQSKLDKYHSLR